MRRAKIVATFGPAIASYENTLAVLEAGVDVARMNMSHGDYSVHDNTYENVRKAAAELGKAVAIMADLQGPKIRLGRFVDGPHDLAVGDTSRSPPRTFRAPRRSAPPRSRASPRTSTPATPC